MRKSVWAKGISLLLVVMGLIIFSPHGLTAESSIFGLQTNQREMRTDLVEYTGLYRDLLPASPIFILPKHYTIPSQDLNTQLYNLTLLNSNQPILVTDQGLLIGEYEIMTSDLIDLVLYQNNQEVGVFGLATLESIDIDNKDQYTIQAQSTLGEGLKVFYGYDALGSSFSDENMVAMNNGQFISRNLGLEFALLPGMSFNADYTKMLEESGSSKAHQRFQLAYNPSTFASFNAQYGIISDEKVAKGTAIPFWPTGLDGKPIASPLDQTMVTELSMALKPTDFSKVSADYVATEGDKSTSRAVFGLHLSDESKELDATYKMENEDNQSTTSAGVRVGLVDLASLHAEYSRTKDYQLTEEALESMVDLGLDLSIAQTIRMRLKYQWVLPEDIQLKDETTAEATFEIDF